MTILNVTNKEQIKELLSKIGNNYICLPNLITDTLIKTYLETIVGSIGHSTNDNKIIVKHTDKFYKFEKPDLSNFINTISRTDSAIKLQENINAIKDFHQIGSVLGFTKEQIPTFNIIILDKPTIISDSSILFMITNKNGGQYLDFVSWDEHGASCNYSQTHNHGLKHSGDNLFGSYFMQSIKLISESWTPDKHVILGGIGYSKTPLMAPTFKNQQPSMTIT